MKSEEVKFSEEKGTDSQFVVIDTFLEKRTAGNEPTESQTLRLIPKISR